MRVIVYKWMYVSNVHHMVKCRGVNMENTENIYRPVLHEGKGHTWVGKATTGWT